MEVPTVEVRALQNRVGEEIGVSGWHHVTQEEVNLFADATHDHQWIHVDPERARRESPFGGAVAHGYYTLSLAPHLISQAFTVTGIRMGINCGVASLRFPAPLRIGESVRIRVTLLTVEKAPGGFEATLRATWEVQRRTTPVCVADLIYRYYP